eukprot:CAMPEP_0201508266 /NCGR_PEP_ID=MMETSP0161_2-20130828/1679_1 /ASSEMBLY_ACC=CAM_ASM_000251 /TAXON_ID=180227 /ORGANISM="Neoparamoeba aestuarina, Strain SoJaBio B1-5/56/2" /LENGTH=287 /DNA_ID=CAMNT_0047902869 /DNA_START=50 /DNA_END=913 /DNA_ORIENTATION=+
MAQTQQIETNVESYYSSGNTDEAYKQCWGEGNIHFGYYPHLEGEGEVLPFDKAALNLTSKMISQGGITRESKVVDFGCGYGLPAIQIARETGATVIGVDLSTLHIKKANELLDKENKEREGQGKDTLKVTFIEGSFTDLPEGVKDKAPFTHVFSQVALCHVHQAFPTILEQARSVLEKDGKFVICDYLGSEGETLQETKDVVWKRLQYNFLLGHTEWKKAVSEANFTVESYLDLDAHIAYGYEQLSKSASEGGFKCADGSSLGEMYELSAKAARTQQIGMNLCVGKI